MKAPPTLKQFLKIKAVKELSEKMRESTGVEEVDGKLIPKSAVVLRDSLVGMTSEKIREIHPEWAGEYTEFVRNWQDKRNENLKGDSL